MTLYRFAIPACALLCAAACSTPTPAPSSPAIPLPDSSVSPKDAASGDAALAPDAVADAAADPGASADAADAVADPGVDAGLETATDAPAPEPDAASPDVADPGAAEVAPDAKVNPALEASAAGCKAWFGQGCGGCACEAAVCAALPECCNQLWGQACAAECAAKGGKCATPDVIEPDAGQSDVTTGPIACKPEYEGSIPGAHFDLAGTPCNFAISKVNATFALPYSVVVSQVEKLWNSDPNAGQCPPQNVFGGVATSVTIEGIGDGVPQKWCLCDVGLCAPPAIVFKATVPGTYTHDFAWDGQNWFGPSDTGFKPGPAFPPGTYLLTVSAGGLFQKPDGSDDAYMAKARLQIQLTP